MLFQFPHHFSTKMSREIWQLEAEARTENLPSRKTTSRIILDLKPLVEKYRIQGGSKSRRIVFLFFQAELRGGA